MFAGCRPSCVAGRTVFRVVGSITQTINVCAEVGARGEYAERDSLPITVDVQLADLAGLPDLDALPGVAAPSRR